MILASNLIAALLVTSVLFALAAADAAAAERRCGDIGAAAPDYYDVRTSSTSCQTARALARAYANSPA